MSDARLASAVCAVGAAATAVFLIAPSGTLLRSLAWSVPFVLAAVMLVARLRASPPETRRPLRLLLAGQLLYLGASGVWYLGPVAFGVVLPFPSPLDVAFFAAYALYAGFLFLALRSRTGDSRLQGRLALTDAAILTLAASAVLWSAVIERQLSFDMPAVATLVAVLYPAAQLLLFALAARLAIATGVAGQAVALLLFVWIGGELLADVFYGVQSANGTFSYEGPLIPVWMLAYTGLAAFAAHPGVIGFLQPAARGDAAAGRMAARVPRNVLRLLRLALLLLAALVPLVLAVMRGGLDVSLLAFAAATFTLAFYRTSLLSGDLLEQRRLAAELTNAMTRKRAQHDELARLAAAVEASHDAIVTCSPEGLVLDWNPGAERLYGHRRDDAVGRHIGALLLAEERESVQTTMADVEQDGHRRIERVVARKDGSPVEVEAALSTIYDPEGEVLGTVAVSRAVTERNDLQRELAAHAQRLDEAQRVAGFGSWDWDLSTDVVIWSAQLYRIFSLDQHVSVSPQLFLECVHPDDRGWVQHEIQRAGMGMSFETRIIWPDGRVRWIVVRGESIADHDGVPVRKTGTAHDITERKLAEAELQRLALTDTLTGLPNRDRFMTLLQSALDSAEREREVGLLLLDLDGFKDVNDGIGHDAGDIVLQEVARRIRAVLSSGDAVARLGGDEFAIVLPDVAGVENAIEIATNVRSCLEPAFELDAMTVHVGASVGVVVTPKPTSTGTLLKKADVAMYRAKTLSCGWAVFEADQDDLAANRLQMVADLRATIDRGDLEVVYQPILDTQTRRVSSFEALARWRHREKGLIAPDQFIPLAEQADLIVPLTLAVLRKAVAACAAWREAGHNVRVGVNLSVQAMDAEDLSAMVAETLAEAGVDAQHLILEITESSLATDHERIDRILGALRELGVTLVIDDFGTGYSAMSYLKQLPVEELKIDRSFIREITTDTRDLAIVRSLIRLAHSLSLRVVAEGVESQRALDSLTALGCDFAQGYGIARPMSEAETAGWLIRYDAPVLASSPCREPTDLLIVDDSALARAALSGLAIEAGWQVREAGSAEEAIVEVERSLPDVVILDHEMTGMSGMDSVPELRARGLDGPILLFTRFLSDAMPSLRVPLDVWPVSKSNPEAVFELLEGYRASTRGSVETTYS